MNFGSMLQLKNAWNTFTGNHPKFPRFLRAAGSCISKDTIIEIKVTTAEGRVLETNLKVKQAGKVASFPKLCYTGLQILQYT